MENCRIYLWYKRKLWFCRLFPNSFLIAKSLNISDFLAIQVWRGLGFSAYGSVFGVIENANWRAFWNNPMIFYHFKFVSIYLRFLNESIMQDIWIFMPSYVQIQDYFSFFCIHWDSPPYLIFQCFGILGLKNPMFFCHSQKFRIYHTFFKSFYFRLTPSPTFFIQFFHTIYF